MSTLGLANLGDRCAYGYAPIQHPALCACEHSEWAVFTRALSTAARKSRDGLVHQGDVRPLIAAIPHKHRGLLYRRARTEGLLVERGMEPSTDAAGRNTDKLSRVYELRAA